MLSQQFNNLFFTRCKTTGCSSKGFPQGTSDNVNSVHYVTVFRNAPTSFPYESRCMRFVRHDHCLVSISEITNFIQLSNRSVHGESAVGHDDYLFSAGGFCLVQLSLQILHVVMLVAITHGFAKTDSVNDGSMI